MPIPKKNKALDRKSARIIIFNTLKSWIISGTLQPGEKILDNEIAEYFSVSRTPVREALQLLSELDLVEIIPSKGTHVTFINMNDIRNIYKSLSAIHSCALKYAFDYIDESTITELKNINNSMKKALSKKLNEKLFVLDGNFHNVILEKADNPYLVNFNNQLVIHTQRIENLNFKFFETGTKSIEEHSLIIKAIEEKDKINAIKYMENNFLRFLDEDFNSYDE